MLKGPFMPDQTSDSAILTAIMEAAVDAVVVSDHSGTILRVNRAAANLFGMEPDQMPGQNVRVLMPAAMARLHDGFMAHHIATGENRIIGIGREVEGQRSDGSVFPLHLSVGETSLGGQRFFVALLHDLTRRKATEEALARSQRLDAVGQMTGGIAHDFNNLLTVIIGNLELLEMGTEDARQTALIKDALEAAELGSDLTSRLMVFARRGKLKPQLCDLRELCTNALAILRRTLGARYAIKIDFAEDADQVMIDASQLQSALMNLALNARDAMETGGELLFSIENVSVDDTYIAQETDVELGDYVRLSVSDNGAGMSEEAQRRAFEPFFTTKGEGGGTGLGLAMVYGFVRQSGGHITLYSEQGHGTSFGLYFPAVRRGETEDQVSEPKQAEAPRGAGQTILVVEDNPKVLRLSIKRLNDLGFTTLEAESGDQAYAMLKAGARVDLVFTDLVMPGSMNGYDLAALIRKESLAPKVLLTSGYASDVVTDAMTQDASYDILHKPYRQSELAARLYALLADDGT